MTKEIDTLLQLGGFEVKQWIISKHNISVKEEDGRTFSNRHNVLGMIWERSLDVFRYSVKLQA